MSRKRDLKPRVKRAKKEVEEDDSIEKDTSPSEQKKCPPPRRSKRKFTMENTKKVEEGEILAQAHEYVAERPRRPRYAKEAERVKEIKIEIKDEREVLNQAIKDGLIWSGYRGKKNLLRGIGWTTGFSEKWWDCYATHKYYDDGWVCTKRLEVCIRPTRQDDHEKLEIGHKDSFYKHISKKVDGTIVCDGARHWLVYLVSDIVKVNQDPKNLEPQCHPCNMKQKNEQSGEMHPQEAGDCPGDDCVAISISSLEPVKFPVEKDCEFVDCKYYDGGEDK